MPPILVLAAAAAMAEPATAAPLTPSSKWNVDYGATACMLARTYATGKAETILALRAVPLASTLELMIFTTDRSTMMRLGRATVAVADGGTEEADYESFPTQTAEKRMMRLSVPMSLFETLPADPVLQITPDKMRGWAFALPTAKLAFEALAKCNDSTVKLWGIDPTERSRIAQPAQPATAAEAPVDWIVTDDYPETMVNKGAQGTSTILWTIGLNGRAADCRTVVTSGEVELDKAACAAILKRARYAPALGFDGKPMISHSTRKVAWKLPWTWSGKR